ncbi:MAG TPA: hypothetical protein VGD22_14445 [Sphingobacteriaceae bacterium]
MKYIYLILMIFGFQASGQVNPGPRYTALGSSGVALQDQWSVRKNQAGLSEINRIVAAVNYEQLFVDENISFQSALIIFPALKNVFALGINRYGIAQFNQQQISLACARKWGDVSVGIGFNYHQLKIQNYGSANALSVDAGFQFQLNESFILGAHIANPSNGGFNNEVNALVPVIIAFGSAWKLSDKILLTSEVQKILNSSISFKFGTEYTLVEWLAARGGVSSNPMRQYFGFGILYRSFRFDASTYNQYYLGFVPQVGLSYEF